MSSPSRCPSQIIWIDLASANSIAALTSGVVIASRAVVLDSVILAALASSRITPSMVNTRPMVETNVVIVGVRVPKTDVLVVADADCRDWGGRIGVMGVTGAALVVMDHARRLCRFSFVCGFVEDLLHELRIAHKKDVRESQSERLLQF